jgi:hypothetical protein
MSGETLPLFLNGNHYFLRKEKWFAIRASRTTNPIDHALLSS